ncbi:Hypothetical_protein [Hexamita inflata]|uniref:Hypothetical_protein n=1 Tax=Hexamita inflata TaxID=28002 RepID=A0AA86QU45_9EUKA|nr:Hypothetical protein HINF_LOCUS50817 [Hexamita inflata]
MVFIQYKQFDNHPGLLGSFPRGLGPQFSAGAAKRVKQIYLAVQLIHKYIVKHVRRSYEYIHQIPNHTGLALSLERHRTTSWEVTVLRLSVEYSVDRESRMNKSRKASDFSRVCGIDGGADTLDTSLRAKRRIAGLVNQ